MVKDKVLHINMLYVLFCLGDTIVLTAKDKKELYAMDLEWSETAGGVQLLEMAIIPLALKMDPLFSYIRPSNASTLKSTIFQFLRVKKKTLEEAPSFDEVILEMKRSMLSGSNTVAIVWHDSSRRFFIDTCRKYGIRNPFRNIVPLKDIMTIGQNKKGRESGFEHFLEEYNVSFKRRFLHHAGYDVIRLKELFRRFQKRAEGIKLETDLVTNINTGVFHKKNCQLLFNAHEDSFRSFEISDLYSGYRLCKVCGRKADLLSDHTSSDAGMIIKLGDEIRRLSDTEQFLESSIAAMCVRFDFEYAINVLYIEVMTDCGKWRLYHDGHQVTKVYHGNHYGKISRQGYHEQKGVRGNLYKVMAYIRNHDSAIDDHETKQPKKKIDYTASRIKKVSHHKKRTYYIEQDEWEEYYD